MKPFFAFAFAALTMLTALQADNRTPLNKGFLQSNLDGNQQSITNLNGLSIGTLAASTVTNNGALYFHDPADGLPRYPYLYTVSGILYLVNNGYTVGIGNDGSVSASGFFGSGAGLTSIPAGQLIGTLPNSTFPATLPAASGANLTALNASSISSGTVADARLSANVPLKDANNVFTGKSTFSDVTNSGVIYVHEPGDGSPRYPRIYAVSGILFFNNEGGVAALGNDGSFSATSFHGDGSALTGLNVFTNTVLWAVNGLSQPQSMQVTNDGQGTMLVSFPQAVDGGTNKVSLLFGSTGNILWNPPHGGNSGELQLSGGSMALIFGADSNPTLYKSYRDLQLGSGSYHHGRIRVYSDNPSSAGDPLGYSNPFVFTLPWYNGSVQTMTPGAQAIADDTNGLGGLKFFANATDVLNGTNWDWGSWGYAGRMITKSNNPVGWDFRGAVIQQRSTASAGSATALDFCSGQCVDLAAGSSAITFTTTNWLGAATNFMRRVFLVRGGGLAPTFSYPTGWNTNGAALPSSLTLGNTMLRLELEATGVGETNVNVLSSQVLSDNTFAWDTDAQAFFGRTGALSGSESNAVNTAIVSLKSNSLWTKLYAFYPFVGSTATKCTFNAVSTSYPITWVNSGGGTFNGNGVKGNGSTFYGTTTFNIRSLSGASNNISMGAWVRTVATGTTSMEYMSAIDDVGSLTRFSMTDDGTHWNGAAETSGFSLISSGTTSGGSFDMVSRTGVSASFIYAKGSSVSDSTTCVGAPNCTIYILNRDIDSSDGGKYSDANLAMAFIGQGYSTSEAATLDTIFTAFKNALGR